MLQQLQHPASRDWTVNDCLRPVSRFFDRIARPEQLLDSLPEAMRVLFDPAETGAVTVAVHQDVQGEAYAFPEAFLCERTWSVPRRPPAETELAAAVAAVRAASRPLLIAGGGVRYAAAEEALATLSREHGIPIAETSAGKGCGAGPLVAGGIGVNGTGAANELASGADLVLCVGTRLTDFTTASRSLFPAGVRFVGINVNAADACVLGGTPVVADARVALAALHEALADWRAPDEHRRRVTEARERWSAAVEVDLAPRAGEPMSQGQALRAINREARAGDWVVAAAGSPPGDLLKLWEPPAGSGVHLEFGFSCMGHELPAGIGIRLAEEDAGEIFVVIGDGTFLMAPTELVTAVQEGAKVTIVLFVNAGYMSIAGLQRATTGISFGNEFRRRRVPGGAPDGDIVAVDYVGVARSLGCTTWPADTPEELREALALARAEPGPAVIVCRVEPRPLLASGAWWDLGVPQQADDAATLALAAAHAAGARAQRFHG